MLFKGGRNPNPVLPAVASRGAPRRAGPVMLKNLRIKHLGALGRRGEPRREPLFLGSDFI